MCKERKSVEVVAAIICDGNKVFATQRGYGEWKDWWEFPGGKIEEGEWAEEALRRSWPRTLGWGKSSQRWSGTIPSFI